MSFEQKLLQLLCGILTPTRICFRLLERFFYLVDGLFQTRPLATRSKLDEANKNQIDSLPDTFLSSDMEPSRNHAFGPRIKAFLASAGSRTSFAPDFTPAAG